MTKEMRIAISTDEVFAAGRAADRTGFDSMQEFSRHAIISLAKRVLGKDYKPTTAPVATATK